MNGAASTTSRPSWSRLNSETGKQKPENRNGHFWFLVSRGHRDRTNRLLRSLKLPPSCLQSGGLHQEIPRPRERARARERRHLRRECRRRDPLLQKSGRPFPDRARDPREAPRTECVVRGGGRTNGTYGPIGPMRLMGLIRLVKTPARCAHQKSASASPRSRRWCTHCALHRR